MRMNVWNFILKCPVINIIFLEMYDQCKIQKVYESYAAG